MSRRRVERARSGAPTEVLVTGAGRGIGRAICEEALKRGYKVHALVRKAADAPAGTIAHVSDIRNRETMREILNKLSSQVDVCIANAGVDAPAQWKDPTYPERACDVFDINGTATTFSVYWLVHRWIAQGRRGGWVAIVSSLAAGRGVPRSGPYVATKTGQLVLCQSLERDLDRYDIGVSVIQPGFIDTDMSRALPNRPFLISADEAARIVWDGLERGKFCIAFPRITAVTMWFMNSLPFFLFRRMMMLMQKWKLV